MIEQIKRAAELNQRGASFLAAGNYESALPCIHEALETIATASHNPLLSFWEAPGRPDPLRMLPPSLLFLPDNQKDTTIRTIEDDANQFIYSKPFFFNPEASFAQEEIISYGAIIIFNLALIYHNKARTFGEEALITARRLYDNCLELLKHGSRFDCSNVIIALLNNRAAIHNELFEFRESCQNFKLLADLIGKSIVRTDTLDKGDLRDIFLNIHFYKIPTCAPCA